MTRMKKVLLPFALTGSLVLAGAGADKPGKQVKQVKQDGTTGLVPDVEPVTEALPEASAGPTAYNVDP